MSNISEFQRRAAVHTALRLGGAEQRRLVAALRRDPFGDLSQSAEHVATLHGHEDVLGQLAEARALMLCAGEGEPSSCA